MNILISITNSVIIVVIGIARFKGVHIHSHTVKDYTMITILVTDCSVVLLGPNKLGLI